MCACSAPLVTTALIALVPFLLEQRVAWNGTSNPRAADGSQRPPACWSGPGQRLA